MLHAPLTYRMYLDDSHAPIQTKKQSESSLQIINKQNPVIKLTIKEKMNQISRIF